MKKRIFSALLTLLLCLALLPTAAFAADRRPDWYFLFAIFKNVDADATDKDGKASHVKYSMTQEEVAFHRDCAKAFEEYMNQVGVMRAHVEIVEIDTPLTELGKSNNVSCVGREQAAPLLKDQVDMDRYDHITCVVNLNISTGYLGLGGTSYENGTGHTSANVRNINALAKSEAEFLPSLYVHEFLHFMERMNKKWGAEFGLHDIRLKFYIANGQSDHNGRDCYTDIILNRAKGTAGTGVHPAVWQYPPHVMRAITEWTVPSGVPAIGSWAFANSTTLTRMIIPSGVTSIGGAAFQSCTSLTSISLPASLTSVEQYAFANCPKLTDVYYGGGEAQWKAIKINSTFNSALTRANIHYNHLMADVKADAWYAKPVAWALEKGIAAGTGEGRFSPDATCTQGQILTFLWRANGEPVPSGKVSGNQYYAAAVQWAKERGLTGEKLAPDGPCTRADVVTYLWKLADSPSAGKVNFSDVSSGAAYAQAVAWAVEQKITSGTGNSRFSPDDRCTRGQIVTFLYSAFAK